MEVTISFVFLEFGFEFAVVGDFPVVVPSALRVVSGDVPQLRRGEPTVIEVVLHLLVVDDFRSVGAGCLQHRTVFITIYGGAGIKVNDQVVEYPAMPTNVVSGGLSAVSPPLKGGVLALQVP